MSDYISKSALIEAIKKQKDDNDTHCRLCMDAMIEIIDEQPTVDEKEIIRKAFERVVERLEEEKTEMYKQWLQTSHFQDKGEYLAYKHATEICKEEGGIE